MNTPEFVYIKSQQELNAWIPEFMQNPPAKVAFDIEGDSNNHRYGFRICLLQIYDGTKTWLIDAVQIKDLRPLEVLIANPDIVKVMYATDFDVRLFFHVTKYRIRNIYDVQLAAKRLGYPEINMAYLMKRCLDLDFVKNNKLQRSDWSRRPLSQEQIEYAVGDVHFLIKIKEILEKEVEAVPGLADMLHDINLRSEEFSFRRKYRPWMKLKHVRELDDLQRVYLRYFFQARDAIARKLDFPLYYVLRDEVLHDWIKQMPGNKKIYLSDRQLAPAAKPYIALFDKALELAETDIQNGKIPELRPRPRLMREG